MHNTKAIEGITKTELELGVHAKASWHNQYKESAYIFVGDALNLNEIKRLVGVARVWIKGGLPYDLTEGDILSVFSQYGEIVNINLVRDKKTGKSKGFCFIGYEDQRSTILAVDNLNSIKLCGRTIRVDHVQQYRRPKDEHGNEIIEVGCAPKTPTPSPTPSPTPPPPEVKSSKKHKKGKKKKKHKEQSLYSHKTKKLSRSRSPL